MAGYHFPYPPDDPATGIWGVQSGSGDKLGEVMLWAETLGVDLTDYERFILSLGPILYWPLQQLPDTDLIRGAVADTGPTAGGSLAGSPLNAYLGSGVTLSTSLYGVYDDTGTNYAAGSGPVSAVCWAKFPATPTGVKAILEYNTSSGGLHCWQMDLGSDHKIGHVVYTTGGGFSAISGTGPAADSALHCYGLSYSAADGLRGWIDGADVADAAPTSLDRRNDHSFVSFGFNDAGVALDGALTQVAIFNRLLSPTEWAEIYSFGTAGHP